MRLTRVQIDVWIVRLSLIAAALVFVSPMFHYSELLPRALDFRTVYSSTRCLITGCNPYDAAQIKQAFIESGGEAFGEAQTGPLAGAWSWNPYQADYPVTALGIVIPVAILPWNYALLLWQCIGAASLMIAALCVVDLAKPYSPVLVPILVAALLARSSYLIEVGQPSCVAIALCAIATWAFLRDRWLAVGVVCFALSLTLKPQIGCFIWVYFFLASAAHRRKAIFAAAATIAFCLPGLLLAASQPQSAHWLHDLSTNLSGIAAPGKSSDTSLLNHEAYHIVNLQSLVGVFVGDKANANRIAWAIIIVPFAAWVYITLRARASDAKDLFGLATVALLTLLPVYHQNYDLRLLFLIFPALALLKTKWRTAYWVGSILAVALIVWTSPLILAYILHIPYADVQSLGRLRFLTLFRPLQVLLVLLTAFYLYIYLRVLKSTRPTVSKRPEFRSITHKLHPDHDPEFDAG